MANDFRDVVLALNASGAKFLIVGAHALAIHGAPRLTGDLDIFVEPTAENAQRVWTALAAFGALMSSLGVSREDFAKPDVVAQFGVPPNRIDIMTSISGVAFGEAWANRVQHRFEGELVFFLGREDFIHNKRASGRPKDLIDIDGLNGD